MAGEENLRWVDALSRPPRKSCIGSQKQQAHQTSGSVLSPIRNERAGVCGRVGVPLFASMGFFSSLLPIPTDPSFVTHERNISGIPLPVSSTALPHHAASRRLQHTTSPAHPLLVSQISPNHVVSHPLLVPYCVHADICPKLMLIRQVVVPPSDADAHRCWQHGRGVPCPPTL